ncbi:unnamed protein product, partial [marine sediment metagenome]
MNKVCHTCGKTLINCPKCGEVWCPNRCVDIFTPKTPKYEKGK